MNIASESDDESATGTETETSPSPSPLAAKSEGKKATQYREIRQSVPDGPECLPLPSDEETLDSEDEDTEAFSQTTEETEDGDGDDEGNDDNEEEEWVPSVMPTPKARASKATTSRFSSVSSAEPPVVAPTTTTKTRASKGRLSNLEKELQALSLGGASDSDLSAYMPPTRKARRVTTSTVTEFASEEEGLGTTKKKKWVFRGSCHGHDLTCPQF
jgi:hypothetical protein